MKSISVVLAMLLASSVCLAEKKIKKVIYEDGSTSTQVISMKKSDPTRTIRRISPVVGLNIADATAKTSGTRVGFNFGGLVDLIGQNNWVLETGLMYRQQGASISGTTFNLNYISAPITGKYYWYEQTASTNFFGKAGAMLGLNVSSTATAEGQSADVKNISTFDLGLLLGVGAKFAISSAISLLLEVDYYRGLTNISSASDVPVGTPSLNNLSFAFMSGASIEL